MPEAVRGRGTPLPQCSGGLTPVSLYPTTPRHVCPLQGTGQAGVSLGREVEVCPHTLHQCLKDERGSRTLSSFIASERSSGLHLPFLPSTDRAAEQHLLVPAVAIVMGSPQAASPLPAQQLHGQQCKCSTSTCLQRNLQGAWQPTCELTLGNILLIIMMLQFTRTQSKQVPAERERQNHETNPRALQSVRAAPAKQGCPQQPLAAGPSPRYHLAGVILAIVLTAHPGRRAVGLLLHVWFAVSREGRGELCPPSTSGAVVTLASSLINPP